MSYRHARLLLASVLGPLLWGGCTADEGNVLSADASTGSHGREVELQPGTSGRPGPTDRPAVRRMGMRKTRAPGTHGLAEGVTWYRSAPVLAPEGLALRSYITVPWGADGAHSVQYEVLGTPSTAPTRFKIITQDGDQAPLILTLDQELSVLTLQVGPHQSRAEHNPDGTLALDGALQTGIAGLAESLAHHPKLDALTPPLVAGWMVALLEVAQQTATRLPISCNDTLVGPELPGKYACARWGSESSVCRFYHAYGK